RKSSNDMSAEVKNLLSALNDLLMRIRLWKSYVIPSSTVSYGQTGTDKNIFTETYC
ncbi:hypothetical protein SOVF_132730, partial [Spinacia oleracea]